MPPVSPDDGTQAVADAKAAGEATALVLAAELALLYSIVKPLKMSIGSVMWADRKLAGPLDTLRGQASREARQLAAALPDKVTRVVLDAYRRGQNLATMEVPALGHIPLGQLDFTSPLVQQTVRNVLDALDHLPDGVTDIYREVVYKATGEILRDPAWRVATAQRALDELVSNGIRGFVDVSGRNWPLDAYVEMAVRTGASHAAIAGYTDTLAAAGVDLVVVSDVAGECPLCRPWERKVLSLSGTSFRYPAFAEARAAGLQHPNCRHRIFAYLPGRTLIGRPERDAAVYEAQQRQRAIERSIRLWKRRQAVALDAAAERRASAKVREWQAAMRAHVAEHDLMRTWHREQIGRAR